MPHFFQIGTGEPSEAHVAKVNKLLRHLKVKLVAKNGRYLLQCPQQDTAEQHAEIERQALALLAAHNLTPGGPGSHKTEGMP